jgi:hypothetical protein
VTRLRKAYRRAEERGIRYGAAAVEEGEGDRYHNDCGRVCFFCNERGELNGIAGWERDEVKKQRKPRWSYKKRTTAEQAAGKRETLRKRDREAAYKCRLSTFTRSGRIMQRRWLKLSD